MTYVLVGVLSFFVGMVAGLFLTAYTLRKNSAKFASIVVRNDREAVEKCLGVHHEEAQK